MEDSKDKRFLYKCSKCAYKTNRLDCMRVHVTRLIKCDEVRDENWVLEKSLKDYDILLERIINTIENIKSENDIENLILISEDLNRKIRTIKQLSKFINDFDMNDIDDLSLTISKELKKRKAELINF